MLLLISSISNAYYISDRTPPCLMLSFISISLVSPCSVFTLTVRLTLKLWQFVSIYPSNSLILLWSPYLCITYIICSCLCITYIMASVPVYELHTLWHLSLLVHYIMAYIPVCALHTLWHLSLLVHYIPCGICPCLYITYIMASVPDYTLHYGICPCLYITYIICPCLVIGVVCVNLICNGIACFIFCVCEYPALLVECRQMYMKW